MSNLSTPPAKVLPFKRTAGATAQKKKAATDGLDGPQSVRKWDRRTLVTLLLLMAIIVGAVAGLSKLVPKPARTPVAEARPTAP